MLRAATPPTPIATTAAAVEEAGLTEANVDDEAAAVAAVVAELVLLPVRAGHFSVLIVT